MNHILPNKPYPQNNHLTVNTNNNNNKNSKDINACKRVGSFKVDIKKKSNITRSKR
jgi:hypothetical protein